MTKTLFPTIVLCLAMAAIALAEGPREQIPATVAPAGASSVPQSSSVLSAPAASMPAKGGLLPVPRTNDPGAQKAAQLLEQMVSALGGEAYLGMQQMQQAGRTYSFYHGEPTGAGALFWRSWKWPDKERVELTKQRDWYITYNGDKGYETTFRGTSAIERDELEDYLRRREHSLPWVLRKWLREPGVALFYEGRAMAERKQAERVSVLNAANEGVVIYIDTLTHLPLKLQFTWRDPKTRDLNEEAESYDNFRVVQGITTPFNITRYRNGDMVSQRFITETTYNATLADSLFEAQPGVSVQAEQKKKK